MMSLTVVMYKTKRGLNHDEHGNHKNVVEKWMEHIHMFSSHQMRNQQACNL